MRTVPTSILPSCSVRKLNSCTDIIDSKPTASATISTRVNNLSETDSTANISTKVDIEADVGVGDEDDTSAISRALEHLRFRQVRFIISPFYFIF